MPLDIPERIRQYAGQLEADATHVTVAELEQLVRAPEAVARRRWPRALAAFAGAAAFVLAAIGAVVVLAGGAVDEVVEPAPTTTALPTTSSFAPFVPMDPALESWRRVGAEAMNPAVGLFDLSRFGDGLVAVGFDPGEEDQRQNGAVFVSDDWVAWTRVGSEVPELTVGAVLIYGVTEGGPGIVAVGMGCEDDTQPCAAYPTVWTSADGTAWTRSEADPDVFGESGAMVDVIAHGSRLIGVGSVGKEGSDGTYLTAPAVWGSPDGLEWTRTWLGSFFDPAQSASMPGFQALTVGGDGLLVGVGLAPSGDGEPVAAIWTSPDGTTWDQVPDIAQAFGAGTAAHDVTWSPSGFLAAGTEAGARPMLWHSQDGTVWSQVALDDQPFDTVGTIGAVEPLGDGYVAAGPHGFSDQLGGWVTLWTSPDGQSWDRVHTGGAGYAMAMVVTESATGVGGGMPGVDNYYASVWAGPSFDPDAPPPDPEPPIPEPYVEDETGIPQDAGLSCDALAEAGMSYPEVVSYWMRHEMDPALASDGDGKPCAEEFDAAAVAAVYGGDHALTAYVFADMTTGTFTVSGPAVESGTICASGNTEFIGENEPVHGGYFRWEDRYTCADGSGSFVLGMDLFIETGAAAWGVWSIVSGTDDYESLRGGGGAEDVFGVHNDLPGRVFTIED